MAAGLGPRAAESVPPHSLAPSVDLLDLLGRNPLFATLAAPVRTKVAERLERHDFPAGAEMPLHRKGQGWLFIVESGRLAAIVRSARPGATQIVSTLGPPDAVGTSGLLLGRATGVSYIALRPAVAHRLSGGVFDAVLRQVPDFATAVARAVAAEAAQFTRYGAVPWADLDRHSFDEQLWACLPSSLTTEHRICPLEVDGDTMTVAMVDPRDLAALDLLSAAVPNMRFRVVACSADDLRRLVGTRRNSRPEEHLSSPPAVSPARNFRFLATSIGSTREADKTKTPSSPPPAVSAIEEIVGAGLASGASDIHIEPERQGIIVRYRIDGLLHTPREPFPTELAKGMVIRLKTLARLDMTETRRPQDGRISVQLDSGRLVDLRVSTLPAKFGEKIALRVLDSEGAITDLKTLFVVDQVRNTFTRLLARRTGFLLVTGPTGSGKSTTLYCALNTCRARNINIMTVEDPIEYHLDGVTQVEVHPEAGTTFATVLRALLRQDPNIMLVGEMRDAETARIAVEASLTGHLVMSSLHANGTLEAIARMRDMGIESYALANGLLAVLHQRLVQRNCTQCIAPFEYPPFVVETLVRHGVLPNAQSTVLMRGAGCARCGNTGMHGRIAVCGMLVINDELREAISRRATLGDLRAMAARSAHIELAQYAGALLRMGLTVPGEVLPLLQYGEG
jgi:type IV pilus assembly protein PilB